MRSSILPINNLLLRPSLTDTNLFESFPSFYLRDTLPSLVDAPSPPPRPIHDRVGGNTTMRNNSPV